VRCLTGKKTRAIKQARTRLQSSALLLAIALLVHSAAPALRALEPPKGSAAEKLGTKEGCQGQSGSGPAWSR
jgi:hypothetical protein